MLTGSAQRKIIPRCTGLLFTTMLTLRLFPTRSLVVPATNGFRRAPLAASALQAGVRYTWPPAYQPPGIRGFGVCSRTRALCAKKKAMDKDLFPSSLDGYTFDLNWKADKDGFNDDEGDDMDRRLQQHVKDARRGVITACNSFERSDRAERAKRDLASWSYTLSLHEGQCAGCGIDLQTKDETRPGFIPVHVLQGGAKPGQPPGHVSVGACTADSDVIDDDEERAPVHWGAGTAGGAGVAGPARTAGAAGAAGEQAEEAPPPICQRCHRLRNHGAVAEELRPGWSAEPTLAPAHFEELLAAVRDTQCVVVTLVDVFDFHGSLLPRLKEAVGRNPLLVAVNKVDLLPASFSARRVTDWVVRECRAFGGLDRVRASDVHLVSAKTGAGVRDLLTEAKRVARDRACDVFVVGAANVGKVGVNIGCT